MRRFGSVILRSCILLALIEGTLWSLSAMGLISLPSVIPLDNYDLGVSRAMSGTGPRLYEPDRWTLNTLRPNVEITYPRLPVFLHGPETYTVHTNSAGMRDREISREKPTGVLRIACLGDSSTFGYNMEEEEGYPRQLQALLDAAHPGRFQVLNFGVPGHASLQGVERLKHLALAFHPDVVTFAFGTNDRLWHPPQKLRDQLHAIHTWRGILLFEARKAFNLSATYRALRVLLFRTGALDRRPAEQPTVGSDAWVGLDEMAAAIGEAESMAGREGFSLLVLNIDLHETDAVMGLVEGARRVGVPLIDIAALFRQKRAERDREIASRLGLAPTTLPDDTHKLVFRVLVNGSPKKEVWMRYRLFPNGKTAIESLYDDGTHGDERAGDGVWSLAADFSVGQKVVYSYFSPDDKGKLAREFSDTFVLNGFPMLGSPDRGLVLRVGGPYIDVYGDFYLHSDPAHPDAEGHRLIAGQLRDAILALPAVRRALGTSSSTDGLDSGGRSASTLRGRSP